MHGACANGMRSLLDFVDTSLLETCVLHATETSDHVDQTGMKSLLDFQCMWTQACLNHATEISDPVDQTGMKSLLDFVDTCWSHACYMQRKSQIMWTKRG